MNNSTIDGMSTLMRGNHKCNFLKRIIFSFYFRKLRAGFTAHVPLLQRGEEGGALHGHDAAGGGLHGHRPLRRDEAREPDL